MTSSHRPLIPLRALPGGLRLFGWVRQRMWWASLCNLIQMPAKLIVMAFGWAALLVGIYALALRGVQFVYETSGLGPFLIGRLWFLFLFVVSIMLAISQLTGGYSTMIRAPEISSWMLWPVSPRTLCRAKWIESSVYSSWAVALLVLPMCLAYLHVLGKPLWLTGYVIIFLLMPLIGIVTSLSTLLLLLWLRWFGRWVIRREIVPLIFVAVCAMLFWVLGERYRGDEHDVWFLALQEFLPRMRLAMAGWLPSSWTATALDAMVQDRWTESLLYAGLLWSTMLVCWRLLDHAAAVLLFSVFREHACLSAECEALADGRQAQPKGTETEPIATNWRRLLPGWRMARGRSMSERSGTDAKQSTLPSQPALECAHTARSKNGDALAEQMAFSLTRRSGASQVWFRSRWWVRRPIFASLVKDLLLVVRDPMQWSQAVMFFGLLGAYFANIDRLSRLSVQPSWRIGIASLNLACTLLVLGSLGVRFLFPQMSLESRKLWLLRTAPGGMRMLVFSKLWFYGVIAIGVVETLLWLSATRLSVPMEICWWLSGVGLLSSLALIGLTIGFGAWWIDLGAQDAARVVSSSNGALVLMLVLCYVAGVITTLVVVWTQWLKSAMVGIIVGNAIFLGMSLLAGLLPLYKGLARLERLEWTA